MLNQVKFMVCLLIMLQVRTAFSAPVSRANEPDSVYLFSYTTTKNSNHNGLHFAWSRDRKEWYPVGNEYGYLKSDYGPWGIAKKMYDPALFLGPDGVWHCVWSLGAQEKVFAHAASADLLSWGRQSYPSLNSSTSFRQPVLEYNDRQKYYTISYADGSNKYFRLTTRDFKNFSGPAEVTAAEYGEPGQSVELAGQKQTGQIHRVPWGLVDKLIKSYEVREYKNSMYREFNVEGARRLANLPPLNATISVQAEKAKPISDMLLGVFFEDINYSADGGLYAELVQNRDFEYALSDRKGSDKSWNATHSWTLKGENASFTIDSASPVHSNNPHYAVIDNRTVGAALVNQGFDGIAVKNGERYNLSFFAKQLTGQRSKLLARLVDKQGNLLAETTVSIPAGGQLWSPLKAVLIAKADAKDASLELQPLSAGRLALDMVSLFPAKTFKGRTNGLRPDLAQAIADIHPRFIRFPGGCVSHGDGLGNIYRWKNTIGPLEARKPQRNIWGYHQSVGLGYFEYFQFCEDIGAAPLPVIAAGVPCQNSGTGGFGQQGGVPMEQMDEYIQDILDLVEWANGPATSKWGKIRAQAGHPKPFNLKYIGIGNEDLITDIFEERFTMIFNALKQKHPEITVIGTTGPFFEGTDYEEGWELASRLKVPMVDEHYYVEPGWFIYNQDFYDKYDRSKPKVYLGEYASRGTTLYNALAEAAYLTSLERNGDVVSMASYAPLLAKEGRTQWNPDLIYFNNTEVKPTVGYYVQKLFGVNAAAQYLPASITISEKQEMLKKRLPYSVVRDKSTGDLIVKMVNLLPLAVKTAIDLKGLNVAGKTAEKTVLQGDPADKNVKPVSSQINLSGGLSSDLPPFSFTVIRFHTR